MANNCNLIIIAIVTTIIPNHSYRHHDNDDYNAGNDCNGEPDADNDKQW